MFKLTYLVDFTRPGFDIDDTVANIGATHGTIKPRNLTIQLLGANKKGRAAIRRKLKSATIRKSAEGTSMMAAHHAARLATGNAIHFVLEAHERFKGDPQAVAERHAAGGYSDASGLACPMVALTGRHGTQYRRTDARWGSANVCRIWLPGQAGEAIETADLISCWGDAPPQIAGCIVSDGWRPELAFQLQQRGALPHGARPSDLPLTGNVEAEPATMSARAIIVVADHDLADDDPILGVAADVVVVQVDGGPEGGWSRAMITAALPFKSAYRNALVVPVQAQRWNRRHAQQVAVAVSMAALSANPYACVWRSTDCWPVFWALASMVVPVGSARASLDGAIQHIAGEFGLKPSQIEIEARGIGGATVPPPPLSTDPNVSEDHLTSFKLWPFDGLSAIDGAASATAQGDPETLDAALWGALSARWWCPATLARVAAYTDAGALSDGECVTLGKAWLSAMLQSDKIAPFWDATKAASMIANPKARASVIIDSSRGRGGDQADQKRPGARDPEAAEPRD